ncbi:MAG: leucyl aminopeptidase [Burkholderiales bacterium]|nr:leucyl aminopeptidase [Burkholderiales bacterium]
MSKKPKSPGVNPVPSLSEVRAIKVNIAQDVPDTASAVGIAVAGRGTVPRQLGVDRDALAAAGFEGKLGQTFVVARDKRRVLIAVGVGDTALDVASLRNAAAAFTRAASRHARLATGLIDAADGLAPAVAAEAVTEGVLLARYRYEQRKHRKSDVPLADLTLVTSAERAKPAATGVARGKAMAAAAMLARDLANAPALELTATRIAEVAQDVARERGLQIEVFGKAELEKLGCGGMLGVNAGSTEPPRMVKLTYKPKAKSKGHLAMVGKGLMYDSGGINIKPREGMQLFMKMDMAGAAAVLGAMSVLRDLNCPSTVTGFLMCTDNMPSGSALKMGDVLTQRNGKTVEIHNTDAEGRLILADGLSLAAEMKPDAVVNIGTLTGAILAALGEHLTGVFSNHDGFAAQVKASATRVDESVWRMPLDRRYRKQIDSAIADLRNMGDAQPGAITAALYLEEFVDGIAWTHFDICGTMKVDADDAWRSKGATGVCARLLADLAVNFVPPSH